MEGKNSSNWGSDFKNIFEETGKGRESYSVVSDSLQPHGLYSPWNSPGKNGSG